MYVSGLDWVSVSSSQAHFHLRTQVCQSITSHTQVCLHHRYTFTYTQVCQSITSHTQVCQSITSHITGVSTSQVHFHLHTLTQECQLITSHITGVFSSQVHSHLHTHHTSQVCLHHRYTFIYTQSINVNQCLCITSYKIPTPPFY